MTKGEAPAPWAPSLMAERRDGSLRREATRRVFYILEWREKYIVTINDELLYACNNPVSFLHLDYLSRLHDTEVACPGRLLLERYGGKHLG